MVQMPIVDGLTSAKMIRSFEQSLSTASPSPLPKLHTAVPIFAVSASLVEKNREQYIEGGFDGWILKPIDFERLKLFLTGIFDAESRRKAEYQPGKWERGGWFTKNGRPIGNCTSPKQSTEDPFFSSANKSVRNSA
jgi:DNA-binding response OmpR family regulator